jgi:hypothetical protein
MGKQGVIVCIRQFVGFIWSPRTERGAIARLLFLPLIGGIACITAACIALHLGVIGHGAPPLTGLLQIVMILVAIGVVWSVACGLWYFLGVAWFMWTTRKSRLELWPEEPTPYLLNRLWRLPLVSASFCWLPLLTHSHVIPGGLSRFALSMGLITAQLVLTYAWLGLVRGVLKWRHGI